MNPRQNLEESAKFVAQLSENDMIKMKIGLNFSPGYCSIESEYQIFNNTNLDLIIEVTNCYHKQLFGLAKVEAQRARGQLWAKEEH